ncbi:MAG: hypothetical protein FJX78_04375 [Armatimonadetes bacterium]|nr:hypothetical protein [Armatimonadota bacterium]
MRVGDVEAGPGQHAYGFVRVAAGRSGLAADVPVHLIAGAAPGPVLLVQGAVHGNEIIASIAIVRLARAIDPARLRGTVIGVPVLNRVGFDLSERLNRMDGKDISTLFPGCPSGGVSDQIAAAYFREVVARANVMVELHAGGQSGYERYILYTADRDPARPTEIERNRRKLAIAFGLDTAAFFPQGIFGTNASEEAFERAGVVMIQPEIGGGTGWHEHGLDSVADIERGVRNVMKALDMIDGEPETDGPLCTVYNAGIVLWKPPVDALFIRRQGFGARLAAGDLYATMQDPYTGETLAEIRTPQAGIVIPSGQEWPTAGTTSIGILGVVDAVEDRRTLETSVRFAR